MPVDDLDTSRLIVRKLRPEDDVSYFSCTDEGLNEFIKEEALAYQRERMGNTYLVFYEEKVVAYFTQSVDAIRVQKMPYDERISEFEHMEYYPALKIGRLAVDKNYEKQGIGSFLLSLICDMGYELSERFGCRFILLNANPDSVSWYERYGFKKLRERRRREPTMYLDILAITNRLYPVENANLGKTAQNRRFG